MTTAVRRPALLTHAFWTVSSTEGLAVRWKAAEARGIARPIAGLPAGLDEPDPHERPDRLRLLGARTAEPGVQLHQMLAYQVHEVVGLATLRAPNRDNVSWLDLHETSVPVPGDERFAGATVYLGLLRESAGPVKPAAAAALGRRLKPLLPPPGDGGWNRTACGFHDGIIVWELPEPDCPDGSVCRRILVVAPESQEEALDRLSWSGEGPMLPPLTRYLLHAARIRYQQEVLIRDLPGLRRLLNDVEDSTSALLTQLRPGNTKGEERIDDLIRRADRLTEVQTRQAGLIDSLARIRTMARTVQIARRNLGSALDPPRFDVAGGPLDADRQLADTTTEQLHAEEIYLQAALDRAGPLLTAAKNTLDERLRDRIEGRTLVQTSVIGALLAVLAAIQSLGYRLALPRSLQGPLIALVGALVLWLPSAVLHWIPGARVPRGWRRLDRILLAVTCAAAGWLGTAAALQIGTHTPAPPGASLAAAAVAAAAGLAVARWWRFWRSGRS